MSARPHIEWQWDRLVVKEGSLQTTADVEALITILTYFGGHMPPGIKAALDQLAAGKSRAKGDRDA
jgi:hypothetical protein